MAALAMKLSSLFLILEAQFIDMPAAGPTNHKKIAAQYDRLTEVVLEMIKDMERWSLKASARDPTDTKCLQEEFMVP